MAAKNLTVVAMIKAKEGTVEKTKQALEALVAPTRAEEGCIHFDFYESKDDKGLFMFFESWTSREALDKHMQAPHIKAFGGKAGDLLAEPIKAFFWEIVK